MRSYVVPEGKAELPRTGFGAGRARGVDLVRKMFRVAKSRLDGNMQDAPRAESTTGSALCRQPRTEGRMWEQERKDTFHDANLCAHRRVWGAHAGTERDQKSERESR